MPKLEWHTNKPTPPTHHIPIPSSSMVTYKNLPLVYAALALATYTQKNKKQKPPINADDAIPQKSGTAHSFAIGGESKKKCTKTEGLESFALVRLTTTGRNELPHVYR